MGEHYPELPHPPPVIGDEPGLGEKPDFGKESDGSFEVDLEVVRWESAEWADCAQQISMSSMYASNLTLDSEDFSVIGEMVGAKEEYEKAQEWVVRLLEGATEELARMASNLSAIADNYEAADFRGAQYITNSYTD